MVDGKVLADDSGSFVLTDRCNKMFYSSLLYTLSMVSVIYINLDPTCNKYCDLIG